MLICPNCIKENEQAAELMFAEADVCHSSGHLLRDLTKPAKLRAKMPTPREGRHCLYVCTCVCTRLVTGI